MRNGFDRDVHKAGLGQVGADPVDVVISVRRAHHELRRIARKNHLEGFSDGVGEIILLNPVPDVEEEAPAGFQDAAGFGVAFDLVRKNITPNWQATASKLLSSKGSASASACRQSIW